MHAFIDKIPSNAAGLALKAETYKTKGKTTEE